MAGIPDLVKLVADLATYEAAVAAGKTSPEVMYLILKERQVYFNSELWSKAPEEGEGGGGSIDPELLEGFIPLQRQFSDDFNNDFAR